MFRTSAGDLLKSLELTGPVTSLTLGEWIPQSVESPEARSMDGLSYGKSQDMDGFHGKSQLDN